MELYKVVPFDELQEGQEILAFANHVVKWDFEIMGTPKYGIVPADGELDALRAELEKAKEREPTTCKWSPDPEDDTWNGDCGAKWTLEYDDPKTNGMNYCPVCGKQLEQVGDLPA